MLLPHGVLKYPNPSEAADSVGRQQRGDKDRVPVSGVGNSGRVLGKSARKRVLKCVHVPQEHVSFSKRGKDPYNDLNLWIYFLKRSLSLLSV